MEGLRIDHCLPPDWKECSIKKDFRGVVYDIHYHNSKSGQTRILADGRELDGDLLPLAKKGKIASVDVYL